MSQRANQVAEELRKIITTILLEDLNDQRIGFVTVTAVKVTDDLRFGKILYSVLGDEEQKGSTKEALEDNLSYIKKLAVERLDMRNAINIKFEVDPSIEENFKIDQILKKIKKKEE